MTDEMKQLEEQIHRAEVVLSGMRKELEEKRKQRQKTCNHQWERCHQMYESFSQCLKCGATE